MNPNESGFELIRRCHDGEASAGDLAMLEKRLRDDAAFREGYVRYMNLDVALEATPATREPAPEPPPTGIEESSFWKRWFFWRLLPVAAGLVIGVFGASVAWAVAMPWLAEAREAVKTIRRRRSSCCCTSP
jgi:anti-sigma factor RsiW